LLDDLLWANMFFFLFWFLSSLNPSFAGWPTLGSCFSKLCYCGKVLIPLLLDDLLWGNVIIFQMNHERVLIPLLLDDLLWVLALMVLIVGLIRLNPSFAGWPNLGLLLVWFSTMERTVLIPLLLDDLLWA